LNLFVHNSRQRSPRSNDSIPLQASAMYYSRIHGTLLDAIVFSQPALPVAKRWDSLCLHFLLWIN